MNLVQIVQLATLQLANEYSAEMQVSIDELASTATAARASLKELLEVARPTVPIVRGAAVGHAIETTVAELHDVFSIELELALPADAATRCTAQELAHLVIGLLLDAGDARLFVRARTIVGVPWIEVVRTTPAVPVNDGFELRAVTAIVERAGGELATSTNRDGGFELIAALPVVEDREVVSSLA